jgi:hypothetical protein
MAYAGLPEESVVCAVAFERWTGEHGREVQVADEAIAKEQSQLQVA